jgi:hypothetical protein
METKEPNIVIKINCAKIEKARLFKGEKGTYLDAILVHKPSQYGDDYFIAQSVTKEEREAGVKGAIIGGAKILRPKNSSPKPSQVEDAARDDGDDVPF